jgi:hypothetical protein
MTTMVATIIAQVVIGQSFKVLKAIAVATMHLSSSLY